MSRTYFPNSIQFDMINENLVKIAAAIEGKIDYSTWEGIQKAVRMGLGAKMFPVGTVLTAKHTTYGDIAFQVVGHNQLRSAVNPSSPTMTLMSVNPIFETEMSTPQAFYLAESELTAGTYCFEISKSIGEWDAGVYSFTLSAPLPQNGHLCIDNGFNAPITSCKVVAYPNIYARSPMLTVSIVSGANGTNLGAIDASLNSSGRITYGSNNYGNSAIRQFRKGRLGLDAQNKVRSSSVLAFGNRRLLVRS